MIIGISVKNFKSIKSIENLYLDRFHVLVGANASGKSTFLDVFEFVKDCLDVGPSQAVTKRCGFRDLTFMRQGGKIEIDLWLGFENNHLGRFKKNSILNYHLSIREDNIKGICIDEEILRRYSNTNLPAGKRFEFRPNTPSTRLLGKTSKGTDFFKRENSGYQDSFSFGLDKCSLALVPPDWVRYPTAILVKTLLQNYVKFIQLNSSLMRLPCPALDPTTLMLDGSNLAKVVGQLVNAQKAKNIKQEKDIYIRGKEILQQWTDHLRYALDDLDEICWGTREQDNAEYISIKYKNGFMCPSWLLSDGTLRMLALTLPAFLPLSYGIYMVEEPENGVHPKALEIIIQSLSNVPGTQTLIATHSPLVVQQVGKDSLLCFSRDEKSGTKIQPGSTHPKLRDWDGTPDLATCFAMGVLE